jgi:hypothetical protein
LYLRKVEVSLFTCMQTTTLDQRCWVDR